MTGPPRWRVCNVSIAEEFAAMRRTYRDRPVMRRVWAVVEPVGFVALLVGQPLAGLLLLGMTLSLASLFTGPPPAVAFWIVAGILALLNALAAVACWAEVWERLCAKIIDPHAILIASGFTFGFGLAAIWVWALVDVYA